MTKINTLLVANRGEIACRVMRTAHALGIRTVAVYSDADADAPHTKLAHERIHIGPPPVAESYLDAEKIIAAAKSSRADAIHPGYGFLSENSEFAKAAEREGIIFVGPPGKAIEVMGDKARSKRAMIDAGVPCIPGYQGTDQSDETLIAEAADIGFPLMVKAAAGGGGRGMRLVHEEKDLADAIKLARSEAENAFGSGDLIIEKAILKPRHVEIQVFGDAHGNIIHLGERDCSVQRRHQKVIEEAPCPVLTPELRRAMGKAAVEAAKAVDYVGAGTVEFLLADDGSFYFLEMNTRLQVEHPVTELVTGLDLVALQLSVAQGHPLPVSQDDTQLSGHAIEVRLYAEDAEADFLPSAGPVKLFRAPEGAGVRVDAGIETGGEISPFYDPMVAKIIAHGATREEARRKLVRALGDTALIGLKNNRDFLIGALSQEEFAEGNATTAFIGEVFGETGFSAPPVGPRELAIAATVQYTLRQRASLASAPDINPELLFWASTGQLRNIFIYGEDGDADTVLVTANGSPKLTCAVGDVNFDVEVKDVDDEAMALLIDGKKVTAAYLQHDANTVSICTPLRSFEVTDVSGGRAVSQDSAGGGSVVAPMHGRLIGVLVEEGQSVRKGDKLAVLEAMKMQHEILAEIDGDVSQIFETAGSQLAADVLIMQLEPADAGD